MSSLTAWEQEWVQIQEDLRQNPGVHVFQEIREVVVDANLPTVDSALNPSLYRRSAGFCRIGSQWRTVEPFAFVTGEFYLEPLTLAVRADPPSFESMSDSDEEAEKEERIAQELRVIDCSPFTGDGSFTSIRLEPGVTDPEVWFDDHKRGLWKMDLDYCTYVDLLRITKGAFGWQHLFTRAPLDEQEFQSTARRIANLLDTLPRLFPDHDYTPLHARAQSRLP